MGLKYIILYDFITDNNRFGAHAEQTFFNSTLMKLRVTASEKYNTNKNKV